MLLIGLTGSIGMGKTETAKLFAGFGVPVYDADAAVHALYAKGGAGVAPIGAAFPDAVSDGAVDRAKLSAALADPAAMKRLEAIIHPLVGAAQIAFLRGAEEKGAKMIVLDIPLLFETGGETRVDAVIAVSAPLHVQRARVLERPGMTGTKLDQILARQVPDAVKRARAHFVIETDKGLEHARVQVEAILKALRHWPARVWQARKAAS
jgi:dephospho-CoA kinase